MNRTLLMLALLLVGACRGTEEVKVDDAGPKPDLTDSMAGDVALDPDGQPPDLAADTQPPPPPPTKWVKASELVEARSWHTATVLGDGRLLVAGGLNFTPIKSAEIYDPATGSWSSAGEMTTPHWGHTAHLLNDGRVLIIGGCSVPPSNTCMLGTGTEIFDPSAAAGQQWAKGPAMAFERRSHCSATLNDGRVVVVGGFDNLHDHTNIEVFDPPSNSWTSPATSLDDPRNQCAATVLSSGKVLISGGNSSTTYQDSLVVFDPVAGSLKTVSAKLEEARGAHAALLLHDGRVLFVGGVCGLDGAPCDITKAEVFDPVTDTVVGAGTPGAVEGARAVLLAGGEVMLTGGAFPGNTARILDTGLSAWTQTPPMDGFHSFHTATLLPGNTVIVVGGQDPRDQSYSGTTAVDLFQ